MIRLQSGYWPKLLILAAGGLVLLAGGLTLAQTFQDDWGMRRRGGRGFDEQAQAQRRMGVPRWENEKGFEQDVFTFARIKYTSAYGRWGRPDWAIDWPEADLNLSFRLQEVTSMKSAPDGVVVELTDPEIFDYPFVYLIEPGRMSLTETEVRGMREYLDRGGFMMVDDFWGEQEWRTFANEMRRVFPDRPIVDLELDHPIFNIVYKIEEKPQIPSIGHFMRGQTTERHDAPHANYRAILDDNGRIMVMICHNTDLGDGWERETANREFFEEMSVKFAYPLGVNIITYAMTH